MNRIRLAAHRRWLAFAVLVVAGSAVGGALAAFPDTNVDAYTGCLNAGGQIGQVAVGASPLQPCLSGQKLVHLSGGDITKVTAGTGLTGGGDNGAVTVGLDAGHSLPQSCTSGQVAKSDGSNAWNCADDNSSTYTAGSGLALDGNTFSVQGSYQLPQGCSPGESPFLLGAPLTHPWSCFKAANAGKSCPSGMFENGVDADGDPTCATPSSGSSSGPEVWAARTSRTTDVPRDGQWTTLLSLSLPAGTFVIDGTGEVADDTGGNSADVHEQ